MSISVLSIANGLILIISFQDIMKKFKTFKIQLDETFNIVISC